MSTFNGIISEIPFISVDYFDRNNLHIKLFFLSHCHSDHMQGLFCTAKELKGPIYTSAISAVFLKKQFPNIPDVRVLEIDSPTEVEHEDDSRLKLTVTTLPAQHCPGSVMFLFETHEHTVLYTGDFRLSKIDFHKLDILKRKVIDSVYLDTTFLDKTYMNFPSQLDSINAICNLTKEWLAKGESYKVIVECPAQYGSEYLFMELGRKLNCKIYVKPNQWEKYIYIPIIDQYLSQNQHECKIYVSFKWDKDVTYFGNKQFKFCIIKPSAQFWKFWKKGDSFVKKEHSGSYRVAISYHSSYAEIKDFIDFIQPRQIIPNVIPDDDNRRRELYKSIREIMTYTEKIDVDCAEKNYTKTAENESSCTFKFNSIFSIIKEKSKGDDCIPNVKSRLLPKRIKRL